MRVAICYNEPTVNANAAEADVLAQVESVARALERLARECVLIPCSLDLDALDRALECQRPDVVFNLVEALGGTDRLAILVPLLLDAREIGYTGAGALGLGLSADKPTAKAHLRRAGLPTPDWFVPGQGQAPDPGCYIVKARHEHASIGMDDGAVVTIASSTELVRQIERRSSAFATAFFAERFVSGREFNVALICRGTDGVEVLPPAEIDFSAFAPGKPNIVGYDAKWSPDSFEYHATPRCFDFPTGDAGLIDQLRRLALDTWNLFGLRGYARVDFRVDETGQPWVLEVNPNPCIAPDAGFAAALRAAGIEFADAIAGLLAAAAHD